MKQVFIFITVLTTILNIKCHVTFSTKNLDLTTILPPENTPQNISTEKTSEKKTHKLVNTNIPRVYLDDVLFAVKNQNWTEEETPCLNNTLLLLHNLQNFTLWAVWDWDSIASQPQGLLYGSKYHLGNFDECMNAPWYKTQPELRTQYCLADIELERIDKNVKKRNFDPYDPFQSALNLLEYRSLYLRTFNTLTWAICAPAVCNPRSVEKLMGVLLAHSHLGTAGLRARISVKEKCQKVDEPLEYDGLFYGFFGLCGILALAAFVCTYVKHMRKESEEHKIRDKIIAAFDLKANALHLLKKSDKGLDVLYGIKFISMCIVVCAHQYGIFNGGPVSNGSQVDQDALKLIGMLFLHDDVVVDSYFVLSGFLVAIFLTSLKRIPNLFVIFLKRYIRLVLAYALVIFYISAVYPYTGSGPLWNRAIAGDTAQCRKNWWISLLMLGNYIDSENICLVVSWYIPCDFHFFIIAVLLYWCYRNYPFLGKLSFIIIGIAAIITPGVINYLNHLPAIQLFTYDFISNPRGQPQFHMTYIKSHTRFAAYLIGFITGYLYNYCSSSNNLNKMSRKWAILGACLSIFTMGVVFFTGPLFLLRNYNVLESAIYAALNRPAWACAMALLVMCCSLGHVPIIKSFLSLYPWVPLSRLSYGLYLVHSVLITRNIYVTRNPQYHDYINIMTSCLGIICAGCFASFIIWLFVEAPFNKLFDLMLRPRIRNSTKKTEIPETQCCPTNGNEKNYTNRGYLDDNLPSTVQVISSKI